MCSGGRREVGKKTGYCRLGKGWDQPCATRGSCCHSKDGDNVPASTKRLGTLPMLPQGEVGPELRMT